MKSIPDRIYESISSTHQIDETWNAGQKSSMSRSRFKMFALVLHFLGAFVFVLYSADGRATVKRSKPNRNRKQVREDYRSIDRVILISKQIRQF